MVEWCDLYQNCKYFSSEYTDFDIFGHDSQICKCSKSGTPVEIPHTICKKCNVMKEMLKKENQVS